MVFSGHAGSTDYSWLFLDLDSYFASVEQQLRPELRGQPIAVVPLMSDTTCAIAASREAKKYGVKTGTMVYDAKRLCPSLRLILARHECYVDYHERIKTEIDRYVPIEHVESIDEFSCRLTGSQCNETAALGLARKIKAGLAAHVGERITCSIGIAPNRYLAKVATDIDKPNGLLVVRGAELPGPLLQLKLRDLTGIGAGMERRLHEAGVETVTQLWALPPQRLRHIWGGIGGEQFWSALRGLPQKETQTQRRTIGHSHVLAPELRPRERAYVVAQRLLLKAASRLRRLGYYAQTLRVGVRIERGPRLHSEQHFHRACDNVILKHALGDGWRKIMALTNAARIKKISITLCDLVEQAAIQPGLFDGFDHGEKQRERLSVAMDKLNARYGRDTVVMGFLPQRSRAFSGTKIAFSRIPDREEFYE